MYFHPLITGLRPLDLTALRGFGIPIAVIGAAFLSVGAQLQSRGVVRMGEIEEQAALSWKRVWALVRRPVWLLGTAMLGIAIALQILSLRLAPLIVVQPVGVVALLLTVILNSHITHTVLHRRALISIAMAVGGVGAFVAVAAPISSDLDVPDSALEVILASLAGVVILFSVCFALLRQRLSPLAYIVGAGVLYGFVASIAKTVINRIVQSDANWLTVACVAGLLVAGGGGLYLVQTAYSVGPPDLVVAGLTVVDPLVAISIGIVVLHEAQGAPVWALTVFALSGGTAVLGVIQLARYHPQVNNAKTLRA